MPARPPPKMIVEIVFADNRTEHIEVRDGDDPSQLARQFLATYKLPASYEKVLREQIVASIAEDERQRQLQKPVDDEDEGAVSPDDDEDAYNAARQSFSAESAASGIRWRPRSAHKNRARVGASNFVPAPGRSITHSSNATAATLPIEIIVPSGIGYSD